MNKQTGWEWEIRPETKWFDLNLRGLFVYKDLLFRLVRRDFLLLYQQTLLGPVWIILQPLLTVLTYVLIFDRIIGISTHGIPSFLFYLAGITLWNLFADIFTGLAGTFTANVHVFSKVYFPRLIIPFATTLLHYARIVIQLLLLLGVLLFYYFSGRIALHADTWMLAIIPLLIAGAIAMGCGLIFSVLIARYKDLMNLLHVLVRLLMFVCPIFFSVALVPERFRWIINLNPLTPLFELFRYALLGEGTFSASQVLYSAVVGVVLLTGGMLLFNKKADSVLDVV
jgi:lipopolysaccharide transport system permease protein